MNTIRRDQRNESDEGAQNILVIGGDRLGLAVAEYLTEVAESVTFVSENQLPEVADGITLINRQISDANDVGSLASEITKSDLVVLMGSDSETLLVGHLIRRKIDSPDIVAGISDPTNKPAFSDVDVDYIDVPRVLVEQIRGHYE